MGNKISPLEALALLYADAGGGGEDVFDSYVDARLEDTFDILSRSAVKQFERSILGKEDFIEGVVLRPDEESALLTRGGQGTIPASIPVQMNRSAGIVSEVDKKLGIAQGATIKHARIMVLKTPHTRLLPIPFTYDETLSDMMVIDDYPLFAYNPSAFPIVAGSFVRGRFQLNTWRKGVLTEMQPKTPYILPTATTQQAQDPETSQRLLYGGAPTIAEYLSSRDYTEPALFKMISPPEAIREAECYDRSSVPKLSGLNNHDAVMESLHPDFRVYAKMFICRCAEKGIGLPLNSGYRSQEKQQRLYANWLAGGKRGPEPSTSTSLHSLGMALDFRALLPSGKILTTLNHPKDWFDSGVPQIAEGMGLRWGGRFGIPGLREEGADIIMRTGWGSTKYDPIHIDFGKTVRLAMRRPHVQAAFEQGIAPNRFSILGGV